MALGCCYRFLKYVLYVYNFIFWLSGCALIACGIWMHLCQNVSRLVAEAERFNHTLSYVLLVVGILILFVGFLGCCGGMKQNPSLLTGYFAILFVLFIALIAIGIYAVVAKDEVKLASGRAVINGVENYYGVHWTREEREFIDRVQAALHCCGSTVGATDFTKDAPPSCHPAFNATPCVEVFYSHIDRQYNLLVVAGVAMSFGMLMIVGMVVALILCCAYNDELRLEAEKDLPLPPLPPPSTPVPTPNNSGEPTAVAVAEEG